MNAYYKYDDIYNCRYYVFNTNLLLLLTPICGHAVKLQSPLSLSSLLWRLRDLHISRDWLRVVADLW